MIHAVAVDIGSARKTIPATAKMFSFVGDGTAVEVITHCTAVGVGMIPRLISLYQEHDVVLCNCFREVSTA